VKDNDQGGETSNFEALDKNPIQGMAYYRLKMMGQNDIVEFSPVRTINSTGKPSVEMFPNPATRFVNISSDSIKLLKIVIMNGNQQIFNTPFMVEGKNMRLDFSGLPSGLYFLKINVGDFQETRKLMIQN